jgi:hypothetical protein
MRLADIPLPSTAAASAAAEVLAEYSAPALMNHCFRAYLFAASRAALDGVPVDHELLYVSALLHDIALEPEFDSHALPFEQASGHVAWVFTAGVGWPAERRARAAGVIVAHMVGADVAVDPEGHLLDVGTGLDISGRDAQRWPAELRREIVTAYPRLDLVDRFVACFRDQATRKPDSSAGLAMRNGLPDRIRANPLDRL